MHFKYDEQDFKNLINDIMHGRVLKKLAPRLYNFESKSASLSNQPRKVEALPE